METIETPLTGMAFKTVYVFDVSQTDGKELPEPVSELTGDVDPARKEAVFAAIRKLTGIEVEFQDIRGGSKGYYNPAEDKIVIKTGMSDAQTLKTVFHEAAHKLLHDPKSEIVTAKSPRNEKEVQAESVAFMVAEKFGLDTSEYSFSYIASWSEGKQLEQLKNALQEIQSAAKQISNAIESELLKMQKRHLSIDEKLADTELNNVQKAKFLLEDCSNRGVEFSEEDTKTILEFAEQHEDISETVQLVEDMEVTQRQRDNYGYVDEIGFKPLEDFVPLEVKQSRFYDELPKRLSDIAEGKIHQLQDNLLKVGNDALKLNVPPAIMREAVYRLNNEKTDKLAESYEKMYERKHSAPDREKSEPAVHKPQRKPKL